MRWQLLASSLLCTLFAVTVELVLIQRGGLAAVPLRVQLTLVVAYALITAAIHAAVYLAFGRGERARWIAVSLCLALVFLPWVNFDYLPEFASSRSIAGNAAVLAGVGGLAWIACRFPRLATVAVVIAFSFTALRTTAAAPRRAQRAPTAHVAGARPNVLFVMIDTLRADHLSIYGYERATSPTLSRLAEDAVVFDTAVSQAPWTKPSIATLFTGLHAHRHGVVWRPDVLSPQLPSFPETMRSAGYQTAAFSSNPWITPEFGFDRGFEYFFQSATSSGVQLTVLFRLLSRLDNRLHAFAGVSYDLPGWLRGPTETNPSNWQRDALLVDAFEEWLSDADDAPFFAYVHFIGPHTPYTPPSPFSRMFWDDSWDGREPPAVPPTRARSIFATAEAMQDVDRRMLISQYDGAIAYTDHLLERIVEIMNASGRMDDTLLVVTSDHGEEFYEHGNWQHGRQMYNEVIRVPLLFRQPERLAAARRMDPAMLVDLFPTITKLVDIDVASSAALQGRDLFADSNPERPVFSECYRFEGATYMTRMVLRDGRKLIQTRDEAFDRERFELFDLRRDDAEQRDLLNGSGALQDEPLTPLLTAFGGSVAEGPRTRIQDDTEERLRALGY